MIGCVYSDGVMAKVRNLGAGVMEEAGLFQRSLIIYINALHLNFTLYRDRLLCLSQLFININMIGCVYSDGVMAKVRNLGAGANRLYEERKPEPTPTPAPKPVPSKPTTASESQRPIAHAHHRNNVRMSSEELYMEDKMKQIRIFLLQVRYAFK
ncbi:unnamed protein product [Strongylus vulgaris]|uniref:XRN2-binding (XTBD) domain-containing protein n=1 Tax=Strongylus vulgaris TaxID=40348 RepID=A0A3P7JA09_STRVU|nr:unnamed protein product [Strongylus vulgaris]